jgi:hypothetical protein
MVRLFLFIAPLILAGCASPPPGPLVPAGEIVDLSHAYDQHTVFWPTAEGFRLERVSTSRTFLRSRT